MIGFVVEVRAGFAPREGIGNRPMWLLKTEPSDFSWDDLEKKGRTRWDGVRNPVAQRNLRAMAEGDALFVYHTGDERAVVGRARVARAAYPDPADPRLHVIDLEPDARLARPVPLARIKEMPEFAESALVKQGRLSVVPLTAAQVRALEAEAR
jgi:predicted RNA-binding protein with PUA-like domain